MIKVEIFYFFEKYRKVIIIKKEPNKTSDA